MNRLFKINLPLWTLAAVLIAFSGDTVNNWILSAVLGPDQMVTTFLNAFGATLATARLAYRRKSLNRYDLALALPALVTCLN
ncbi:hypothetical protein CR3_gp157 [Cronobacter phage CR3]|uniref:Uncharacterized protein n=1 Tax=Cronobacter phage CR3 TaxID=1162295 RepID=I1TRJ9_9CAUD|nr:hypothetical protein CR3_gp157 [Cronobacter phage CR3]AFH21322.1 hypothetical protein CR3_157 [Cronobacter phage CR3]KAB3178339.1 hypothetical protein F9047_10310 [Escherichia coli]